MQVLVLGTGLMGPAAAFNAMADPAVTRVGLVDESQAALDACLTRLGTRTGADKLAAVRLDLSDTAAAAAAMAGYDAVVSAVPAGPSAHGIRAALRAGVPLVSLTWPDAAELPDLRREAEACGCPIVLGCGVEPGLTEIMARHLAERLERVDELHIKCGGIPETPEPPLGYKIVFGGRQLPLRDTDVHTVQDGRLTTVPRYSGVEPVSFAGVGECEAWHDGLRLSLLDLAPLAGLRVGTQKTVRWPGYAAKATLLRELGLLSQTPVTVDGVPVAPKRLLDAVLYPRVRLAEGERDITVVRVEVVGEAGGDRRRYAIEMVDRYDQATGFTSMARTTSFTAAIVARMIARGDLVGRGLQTPEQVVTGPLVGRLVAELSALGLRFDLTEERTGRLEPAPPSRAPDALAPIREWLRQWQDCVRTVDFARGRALCDPGLIAFGTIAPVVEGVDRVMREQWQRVWPCIRDFTIRIADARGGVSGDRAWVAAPWDSLGVRADGSTFLRPGRLTISLARTEGRWRATHTHFSLAPDAAPSDSPGHPGVTPAV